MSGAILDGSGKGFRAKVNQRQELQIQSRAIPHAALKCVAGEVFLLSTPWRTVNTTGGRMLWLQFSDPVKYLVLDQLMVSWNGGNTNHNKPLKVEYVLGDTQPTTGTTPWAVANTNSLSTNTLSATILMWDGSTGNGMTGHTSGATAGRLFCPQGYTTQPIDGKMIVGPGMTLAVNAVGIEEGEMSFSGYVYLFDPRVDG